MARHASAASRQRQIRLVSWLCLLLVSWLAAATGLAADLSQEFQNPPGPARPWVYWYWMNGAVSRQGITADLEAMKQAGLGGAYLMPIGDVGHPPIFQPPARQLSPQYWALLRHAFGQADRLGLKLALHDCDGFATAGGPWITPALAMQKVVWTETQIQGGRRVSLVLAQPPANEHFYRDIAVLAFPTPPGEGVTSRIFIPKVTTSLAGLDARGLLDGSKPLHTKTPCWIQYAFDQPFTCRSIVVQPDGANYQALRLIVEFGDDGTTFHSLGHLETPRHGWEDSDAPYTFAIPATTARFFRFVYDPAGSEPGAEDLDSAKWKSALKIRSLELSTAPRIPDYEGKSGVVWRRSSRANADLVPDNVCVPLADIHNLTGRMDSAGKLVWTVPPGRWTILRIGYTPTGHENATGGGGKGLECDKFNPAAARVQFNGWFGQSLRVIGPTVAGRVLKIFHVDSWEAGSQNWSPVFLREFRRRRGYDPTPYLPAFAGIPVGSADISERFLFDVRQTIAELTVDNFFGTMARLAHRHGCQFSAESVAPTMMSDGMRHFGRVDLPMGEFWLRSASHDKPNDIADAISGAHVYGKKIVQAEAFTELRLQWDENPSMLKALGDHNFCLGINRLVLHVFVENPWTNRAPGMTLNGVGTFFQRDQTWWPMAGAWIDYLRRCQFLLQQGRPVADALYFTGEELPSRALLPERRVPTLPPGYAADSINRDALLRLATVKKGRIVLPGGASYAVLVLPPTRRMTPQLARKIKWLADHGATVIGPRPERSPSLEHFPACDRQVQKIADELWGGDKIVASIPLEKLLKEKNIAPDFQAVSPNGSPAAKIEWTHRTTRQAEIYFVSNQAGQAQALKISLRETGRPELWDPVTGQVRAAAFRQAGGRTVLPVRLAAHGSLFIMLQRVKNQGLPQNPPGNSDRSFVIRHLAGPWQVDFDPSGGGPGSPAGFPHLASWTTRNEPGIRFYSGIATYHKQFQWSPSQGAGRVWLDLGAVDDIADVIVNGRDCGVAWTAPFRVEITHALRPGNNRLEIRVANTWANRLIGDQALPPEQRRTWTNAPFRLQNSALLPSGLLGPVTLRSSD